MLITVILVSIRIVSLSLISCCVFSGILGTPAEVYLYGTQFMLVIFANIFGTLLGAYLFLPIYYKLQMTSTFEVCIYVYKTLYPLSVQLKVN